MTDLQFQIVKLSTNQKTSSISNNFVNKNDNRIFSKGYYRITLRFAFYNFTI